MGSDADTTALVDEAMKKSGLIWVSWSDPQRTQAFWHSWVEGHGYLLTGYAEQPDPHFTPGELVRVVARSKDNTHRLIVLDATAERLSPSDPDWEQATTALAAGRLNLHDAEHAPQRWAADAVTAIYRLSPTGPLVEEPGRYTDDAGRAAPVASPATTAGAPPWVMHRRGTSGRSLS